MGSLSLGVRTRWALAGACVIGLPLSTTGLTNHTLTGRGTGPASAPRVPASATGGVLNGVACVSTSWCMAVGDSVAPGSAPPGTVLAELWNGSIWSVRSPAKPPGSTSSVLTGVACTSSKDCLAVGNYGTATNPNGSVMAERWNGSSWAFLRPPTPSGAAYAIFNAVSCPTTTRCVVVGYWNRTPSTASLTLAELWNGSSWKIDSQPVTAKNDIRLLKSVSCLSTTFCMAVGNRAYGTPDLTLAETGNGTSWTAKNPPNEPDSANYLNGLRCTTTRSCIAVGEESTSVLVETWNGSGWSIAKSPNPPGSLVSVLSAVSCSGTLCVAVGDGLKSSGSVTLTEFQSGTKWVVRASPNVVGGNNTLAGVSCTSTTACIAVGSVATGGNYVTLAEKMTGSSWTITRS